MVIEIQLAFAGKIAGTKSRATIMTTYDTFAIIPILPIVLLCNVPFFELSDVFLCVPFFSISDVFTWGPFSISDVTTANPTEESMITDVAVKSSNLAKVAPE